MFFPPIWKVMILIPMFFRQKLNQEYSEQFLAVFQQWDTDLKKAEEQEEKLVVGIAMAS